MDIIDAPQPVPPPTPVQPQVQPVAALANLDPQLDDAAVRAALMSAEQNNLDPMSVTLQDMTQGQSKVEAVPAPVAPNVNPPAPELATLELPKVEVPQKFLKPDGTPDVEKIQTSTKQLAEAVQAKETAVQKTVEEYLKEYRDLEKRLSSAPNPQKLAAQLPTNPPPMAAPAVNPLPQQMTDQQLEEMINRDIQTNPGRTITQLIQLALDSRFQPIEEDRKLNSVRENLQQLAAKDPRIMQPEIYKAINEKLAADPDYWKLKNPHRAAWLDVKEELRLGDTPQGVPAQPSRLPAPVLGGGTPPSAPSVTIQTPQNVLANLDKLDLRDRRQEAEADAAIRAMLARGR